MSASCQASRGQQWETLPIHPPPGVWAGKGIIPRALKVHVRNNSFGQRGEPEEKVLGAEQDPSS